MDYHSKFEFDRELKENLNLENIPESSIDAHFKKFEGKHKQLKTMSDLLNLSIYEGIYVWLRKIYHFRKVVS